MVATIYPGFCVLIIRLSIERRLLPLCPRQAKINEDCKNRITSQHRKRCNHTLQPLDSAAIQFRLRQDKAESRTPRTVPDHRAVFRTVPEGYLIAAKIQEFGR
jgi:hypothetical protein